MGSEQKPQDPEGRSFKFSRARGHSATAVGVSGGPDSMALCLLAAEWKISGLKATSWGKDDVVDGLLAIIVDHGLREESKDEAEMVQRRVLNMEPSRHHSCASKSTKATSSWTLRCC